MSALLGTYVLTLINACKCCVSVVLSLLYIRLLCAFLLSACQMDHGAGTSLISPVVASTHLFTPSIILELKI
ncbi:hypothetical protein HD806DRAFT_515010 [Xylariaceae sp. AK1471]|nr:hypothetical protein HD806DRAFT_515010 [Xylariaceae sp. AK1471]